MSQHSRQSKLHGGRIPYGPASIFSRRANRYKPGDVRPQFNNLKSSRESLSKPPVEYGVHHHTGALIRLTPKSWNSKAARRQVLRARREDRAVAAANLNA